MRLIAHQHLETVSLGVNELVEVSEHALNSRGTHTSDAAKSLGERARTSRVQHRPTLTGEFTDQRQADHALSRTWAAADDDDFF